MGGAADLFARLPAYREVFEAVARPLEARWTTAGRDAPRRSAALHRHRARCRRRRGAAGTYPVSCWMISTIGRNSAITMKPTTTAKNTIMMGSMIEVMPATALSTSSS